MGGGGTAEIRTCRWCSGRLDVRIVFSKITNSNVFVAACINCDRRRCGSCMSYTGQLLQPVSGVQNCDHCGEPLPFKP